MCSVSGAFGHLGPTGDPCGSYVFEMPRCLARSGRSRNSTLQTSALPKAWLTALNGVGRRLQGHNPAAGLRDVHSENEPHTRVLSPDVCLAFPQLNVGISKLQDSRTVDATRRMRSPFTTNHLSELEWSPTKPPSSVSHIILPSAQMGKLQCTDKYFSREFTPRWGWNTKQLEKFPSGNHSSREIFSHQLFYSQKYLKNSNTWQLAKIDLGLFNRWDRVWILNILHLINVLWSCKRASLFLGNACCCI